VQPFLGGCYGLISLGRALMQVYERRNAAAVLAMVNADYGIESLFSALFWAWSGVLEERRIA
jgi:hypothetical protein